MITQLQVEINKVDAEKIRPLRHSELRKGQDFSTTSYLKDYEEGTFHMACIVDDEIVTNIGLDKYKDEFNEQLWVLKY